jgi:Fur family iron response transcriptional regulator
MAERDTAEQTDRHATGGSPAARARAWLASAGLRPTRQRQALAQLLVGDGCNRHVTAEGLFEAAQAAGEKVSLATVYNTLHSFTHAGLMAEITVDGSRSYFDTDVSDHAHYFWEEEGRLSDAPHDAVRVERVAPAPEGAEIAKIDVVIRLRRR